MTRLGAAMGRVTHTHYREIGAFTTKDGSVIRELMHPAVHAVHAQSFAEATIPPGAKTLLHRHAKTEEIYHVTAGAAMMTLGEQRFLIARGDTICIAPGTPHRLENFAKEPLVILCACTPAYSHEDTEII